MAALKYWLWLTNLPGLSNRSCWQLLEHFDSPEEIYYADEGHLLLVDGLSEEQRQRLQDKSLHRAEEILAQCAAKEIFIVTVQDAAYPHRLRSIYDAPVLLYGKGAMPLFDEEAAVAVVGTRKCSPYGIHAAEELGYQMAKQGALLVSGMAEGIDAAAMKGALRAGGFVAAILGGGVDVIYPASNRSLYEAILRSGCILSEYPPGMRPGKWTFPKRNRIVSGLSCAVLAVEAPENSGTMITARLALEQGRDLFVIPGHIASASCAGSNALLRDGARVATCGWDILREYEGLFSDKLHEKPSEVPAWEPPVPKSQAPISPAPQARSAPTIGGATEEEQKLLQPLLSGEKTVDDLVVLSGLETKKALALLTMLEIKGMIQILPGRRVTLS